MTFALVPAGEAVEGSSRDELGHEPAEGRPHEVEIPRSFWIGVCEVTQAQYEQVMAGNPSRFRRPDNPVECVSWDDAVEFCRRLSERDGRAYRLPTEAEWEYACRAGSTTAYCFGDDPAQLDEYAWYAWNSGETTHPVGLKLPNAWGLYDMHGNVWEWCQDEYSEGDPTVLDAAPNGTLRVVRGGSYFDHPSPLRSASRGRNLSTNREDDHGFRVACEAGS